MNKEKNAPIPLLIGVTGHRDILDADVPRVRKAIHSILSDYQSRFPNDKTILITMLSAGADLLAAEVALESGLEIIGLLPFDQELYLDDFPDEGELLRFQSALRFCSAVYTVPIDPRSSRDAVARPGGARDDQYALGGAFMARYSHALIAVWDGLDAGLRGGTADIVRMRLDAAGRPCPVHWVYASRKQSLLASPVPPERLPFDCEIARRDGECLIAELNATGSRSAIAADALCDARFGSKDFHGKLGELIKEFCDETGRKR